MICEECQLRKLKSELEKTERGNRVMQSQLDAWGLIKDHTGGKLTESEQRTLMIDLPLTQSGILQKAPLLDRVDTAVRAKVSA